MRIDQVWPVTGSRGRVVGVEEMLLCFMLDYALSKYRIEIERLCVVCCVSAGFIFYFLRAVPIF